MPRLVKGAKWTYGWVLVGQDRTINLPPQALSDYGFHSGDEAIFTPGSTRSGGFGLSTPTLMHKATQRLNGTLLKKLARGRFNKCGRVAIPPEIGTQPGDRLLTVRGSCYALGFVTKGPIYNEALKHPLLECFE